MFSTSADDTVRIEPETSIMAALDGRLAKPAPTRPVWALWGGLGAVAIAAGLAGWWWQSGSAELAAQPAARAASAVAEEKVAEVMLGAPTAEAAPSTLPTSAPAEVASAPGARAVIEETASGESKPGAVPEPTATAASGLAVASAAAPAAAVVAEARTAKVHKPQEKVAATPAAPAAPAKERSKETAVAVAEAKPTAAPEPALRSPAPKDADVELLAALMHYSDEVGATAAGKAKAQTGVARMSELTIADLVQRCKALGGDEATQCKKRICSGYWGKAEACPAKQAPKPAKPKKSA